MNKRLTDVLLGFASIIGAMAPEGSYMEMPLMDEMKDAADEHNHEKQEDE